MDSMTPHVQELLGFPLVKSVRNVHSVLQSANMLKILDDPMLPLATSQIVIEGNLILTLSSFTHRLWNLFCTTGKTRPEIDRQIKYKEAAQKKIKKQYATYEFDSEAIHLMLMSMNDHHSYLW